MRRAHPLGQVTRVGIVGMYAFDVTCCEWHFFPERIYLLSKKKKNVYPMRKAITQTQIEGHSAKHLTRLPQKCQVIRNTEAKEIRLNPGWG